MTSRRRKNSIKFCDSIGLEVATLRPNIGLKVATLRPMFRFGKVTHTYLASTSPGLNVVWPQRRLASTSSGLNVVWPHCRWPQRRGLKVAWPQCPIGLHNFIILRIFKLAPKYGVNPRTSHNGGAVQKSWPLNSRKISKCSQEHLF